MNLILQAIKALLRKTSRTADKGLDIATEAKTLAEVKPDWNQNDPTAPDYIDNRPFYKARNTPSIEGLEYEITSNMIGTGPYYHKFIPLEVGQTWDIYSRVSTLRGTCEVKMDKDGTCYIGTADYSEHPFYITPTTTYIQASWISAIGGGSLKIVGVSGTFTVSEVHQIDPQYIKDMYYDSRILTPLKSEVLVSCAQETTKNDITCYYTSVYAHWTGGWEDLLNKTVCVIFDGEPYDVLITNGNEMGDISLSDYPFYIYYTSDRTYFYVKERGAYTFAFYLYEGEGLKQLNKKYLPKAAAVTNLTAAPTAADFNNLLAVLREAGYLAE